MLVVLQSCQNIASVGERKVYNVGTKGWCTCKGGGGKGAIYSSHSTILSIFTRQTTALFFSRSLSLSSLFADCLRFNLLHVTPTT